MTDSKPFAGKLALVTGASRGIGAATAEALAAAGAHVILVARNGDGAGSGRGAHPRRRRKRDHRAARPHRRHRDRQARRRGRRALGGARHPRPQRRDARVADPGPGPRPQGIFAAAEPQPARQPGDDRGLRPAAAQGRQGRGRRGDLVGRAEPRAFWGGYGASKAALETLDRRLCRRDRAHQPDAGPYRRSRRDPDADAQPRLSRARSRKASSRPKRSPKRSSRGCSRTPPTGERMRVDS